jgi:hypothetical protein
MVGRWLGALRRLVIFQSIIPPPLPPPLPLPLPPDGVVERLDALEKRVADLERVAPLELSLM